MLFKDPGSKEIVRAIIEAVAYQTYDLFEAMKHDGLRPKIVKVDGGMVMNNCSNNFFWTGVSCNTAQNTS